MAHKAPGKHYRNGVTITELIRMFPSNEAAEAWFIQQRWPNGVHCPKCESDNIQERASRKPQPLPLPVMPQGLLNAKTGTLMQGSNLGFQKWAIAIYLMTTGIKGVSSMRLHRELGITQKSAWFMEHRIRETWEDNSPLFRGPCRSGRNLHWREGKEQARRQSPGRNARRRGQGHCGSGEGSRYAPDQRRCRSECRGRYAPCLRSGPCQA